LNGLCGRVRRFCANLAASVGKPTVRRGARSWGGLVAVLFFFGLPLFIGLGAADMGNDEAIYSFAVRQMLHGGSWLTPASIYRPLDPPPFVEKPPLKLWVTAAGIASGLLPENAFGLRFFDAFFGMLCLLYIYLLGKRLGGPAAGFMSALLFFSLREPVFIHGFRSNNMDSILMLAFAGGVYHFLASTGENNDRRAAMHVLAVVFFFVAGFLSKFVAVFFLPLVLGAATVLEADWRRAFVARRRVWIAGGVLALALIAPWFIYQHLQLGAEFWAIILGDQVLRRITVGCDPTHLAPWYAYLLDLGRSFLRSGGLPAVVGGSLYFLLCPGRRHRAPGRLLMLWAVLPLVILSAFRAKLGHYIYPELIPLALMGGVFVAAVSRPGTVPADLRKFLYPVGALMFLVVLLRGPGFMEYTRSFSGGLLFPLLALGSAGIFVLFRPGLPAALVLLAGPIFSWGSHMERILGTPHAPFSRLASCLESRCGEEGLQLAAILKPEGVTLLHSWAYYGNLPLPPGTGATEIRELLEAPDPMPVWLRPEDWQAFAEEKAFPEGCLSLKLPHLGFDGCSPMVLVLPEWKQVCAQQLLADGAEVQRPPAAAPVEPHPG